MVKLANGLEFISMTDFDRYGNGADKFNGSSAYYGVITDDAIIIVSFFNHLLINPLSINTIKNKLNKHSCVSLSLFRLNKIWRNRKEVWVNRK